MVNIDLMERVLGHIEAHPEQHEQGSWFNPDADCGTAACFAGWACLLEGQELAHVDGKWVALAIARDPHTGATASVPTRAARLLDIDRESAQALFHGGNTLVGLRQAVKDLANGEDIAGRCYGECCGGADLDG